MHGTIHICVRFMVHNVEAAACLPVPLSCWLEVIEQGSDINWYCNYVYVHTCTASYSGTAIVVDPCTASGWIQDLEKEPSAGVPFLTDN